MVSARPDPGCGRNCHRAMPCCVLPFGSARWARPRRVADFFFPLLSAGGPQSPGFVRCTPSSANAERCSNGHSTSSPSGITAPVKCATRCPRSAAIDPVQSRHSASSRPGSTNERRSVARPAYWADSASQVRYETHAATSTPRYRRWRWHVPGWSPITTASARTLTLSAPKLTESDLEPGHDLEALRSNDGAGS